MPEIGRWAPPSVRRMFRFRAPLHVLTVAVPPSVRRLTTFGDRRHAIDGEMPAPSPPSGCSVPESRTRPGPPRVFPPAGHPPSTLAAPDGLLDLESAASRGNVRARRGA